MSSPIHRIEDDEDQPFDRRPSWLSGRRKAAEPPRPADIAGPTFSGDRALMELNRQLSRTTDIIPEAPPALEAFDNDPENPRPMVWRFFSLVAVAAAIAWGIVLLPTLRNAPTETSQTGSRQTPGDSDLVKLADATPTTRDQPAAQNELSGLSQPRVVSVIPISKPRAPTVPPDPPSNTNPASLPADPVATSFAAAPSPSARSSPGAAVTTAAASSAGLTAEAEATARPDPTSLQPSVQPALPSRQGMTSAAPATPSNPKATSSNGPSQDRGEIAMLLSRGKDFLASGDLSSAQLLFRRAAEAGSAEAALNLASTYDPHYLADHKVVGVMGDEEKARTWYQRAIDLGSAEASRRLAELDTK